MSISQIFSRTPQCALHTVGLCLILLSPNLQILAQSGLDLVRNRITSTGRSMEFKAIENFAGKRFLEICGEDLKISQEEYRALPEVQNSLGFTRDSGQIASAQMSGERQKLLQEFRGKLGLNSFSRLDRNSDGFVSKLEYLRDVMTGAKSLDRNNNRVLELSEVRRSLSTERTLELFSSGRSFETHVPSQPGGKMPNPMSDTSPSNQLEQAMTPFKPE